MSEEAMGLDGGIFSVGIGEQPPSRRGLLRRAQQPPGRQSSGRTARPARATGLPCAAAPLSFLPQRQQRGPCMADNIQARAFAHGDIRIRAVHRDDHGQWLPLWHAYNVFYGRRSEEHTSELPSLMRISYAVFCLNKKQTKHHSITATHRHTTSTSD